MIHLFSILSLILISNSAFANTLPMVRVVSSKNYKLRVSVHDFSIACSPHINGSNVGLKSKTLDNFLQKRLLLSYDLLDHPNHPTRIRSKRRPSCKEANDLLRSALLAASKAGKYYEIDLKITLSEHIEKGFGMSSRTLRQVFEFSVGRLEFSGWIIIGLERKRISP